MPKEPKRKASSSGEGPRHAPLGQVIREDSDRGKFATMKRAPGSGIRHASGSRWNKDADEGGDADGEGGEELLDERTSKKILELGRVQRMEMEAEEQGARVRRETQGREGAATGKKDGSRSRSGPSRKRADSSDEESDDDEEFGEGSDDEEVLTRRDGGYVTVSEHAPGLTPEEEALISSMMGGGGEGGDGEEMPEQRETLADIIMKKIEEKEAMQRGEGPADEEEEGMELPVKVVQVYTDIGKILARYTSGKLPKAFKVLPSLSNWEEVLYLTRPDLWTPQAMYAATRIFASNLNPKMAQRFYNLVLLDAVRADIYANKKLNYHYFLALKKAVYKPAAFFKGILLPLCKENCTLREAAIVASALQRVSIPVHHSAVAIHKLAQMDEYSGAASVFIKALLNKKYSLPAPVIGSLVKHFAAFSEQPNATLPVLWHQALLAFVERYKNEVKDEARDSLRDLMKIHNHPKITPEIRRELFGAQAWKEERMMTTSRTDEGGMQL